MPSFAFFFNSETFDAIRRRVDSGTKVPIDYVGAAERMPFKNFAPGDELFIVGLSDFQVHLGGRLVVSGRPLSRADARARSNRNDLIDKPLICFADPAHLDFFRPDLKVPAEIAKNLELFSVNQEPVNVETLRAGRPDPNLFRACPRLSDASATQLRNLLGSAVQGDEDADEFVPAEGVDDDDYRTRAIKTRRGQDRFRRSLLAAYGRRCQVTSCRIEEILEAAHITPHAELTDYRVSNGLLLRSDIHTLFDLDLITVDEAYRIRVSPRLRYSEYWVYEGRQLDRLPDKMADQPDRGALKSRAARLKPDVVPV